LQGGASFTEMVTKYSNDNYQLQAAGADARVWRGENTMSILNRAVFALPRDGALSANPFLNQFLGTISCSGVERVPVNSDKINTEAMALLKQARNRPTAAYRLRKKIMEAAYHAVDPVQKTRL